MAYRFFFLGGGGGVGLKLLKANSLHSDFYSCPLPISATDLQKHS